MACLQNVELLCSPLAPNTIAASKRVKPANFSHQTLRRISLLPQKCHIGAPSRLRCSKALAFQSTKTPLNRPISAKLTQSLSAKYFQTSSAKLVDKKRQTQVACTAGDFVSPAEGPLADAVEPPPIEEEELSQLTLIWRAVKLPIYTVALIPILVGAAAAYQKTGVFYHSRFWTLLGSSCLVIAWLNLTNDVFDSDTEVDKNKRESVVNMTGSRNLVLVVAIVLLAIAFGGFASLAKTVNDPRMLWLLAGAVACGYVYQSPPFRLGYLGLGEPLCFISFGPMATSAFYLSQVKKSCCKALPEVTPTVLGASVLVGITTTLILFCSHFHQIEDDRKVGKMSPLVRLGTAKGAQVARTAVNALYLVTGGLVGLKLLPLWCGILSALTIPIGKLVKDFISKNHENKVVIFMAKYFATRLHIAHGAAIALGLAASVWKPLPFPW